MLAARLVIWWASIRAGNARGTLLRIESIFCAGFPSPFSFRRSSAFSCSQFFRTWAELLAFTLPKTWGWRRTIFVWMDSITSRISNWLDSLAIRAWKMICRRRSPNSLANFLGSPESMASRTSWVSSRRNVRNVAWVCSRSHGQPFGARRRACRASKSSKSLPAGGRVVRGFWRGFIFGDGGFLDLRRGRLADKVSCRAPVERTIYGTCGKMTRISRVIGLVPR
jgi:hypothetical protein